jgi:hypothetical protein
MNILIIYVMINYTYSKKQFPTTNYSFYKSIIFHYEKDAQNTKLLVQVQVSSVMIYRYLLLAS